MLKPTEKIWRNGHFIPWDQATIHVLSHVVSYGTSVFEGIRCYSTPSGPAIFRLHEHVRRMTDSAKIYRMENLGFSREQLADAMVELVRVNKLDSCYLRPIVIRGYGDIGVNPLNNPIDVYIACWVWGKYLGEEALAEGVDVCVSSWNRLAPNTLPTLAKAGANYMNSQLIKMEALANGYSEGIALDTCGLRQRRIGRKHLRGARRQDSDTPPLANSVLPGITRDTVLHLAQGPRHSDRRNHGPARDAVHRRRGILLRHGGRDHADPLHRSHPDRQGDGADPSRKRCRRNSSGSSTERKPDRYGWLSPVHSNQPVGVK